MEKIKYKYEEWLTNAEKIEYSDYWNDEFEEKSKIWWTVEGNYSGMEDYLREIDAIDQLETSAKEAKIRFNRQIKGSGADLAAGTLWATPQLLRLGAEKVYSVEYSRHRLLRIAPFLLEHYQVDESQAVLILGDFNRLKFAESSLDFVFMSQAFHHTEKPRILLREIKRVLKPSGLALFTGEHITKLNPGANVKSFAKYLLARLLPVTLQKKIFGHEIRATFLKDSDDFLSKDEKLGDHYYTDRQYRRLFTEEGFEFFTVKKPRWKSQAFILTAK